MPRDYEIKYPEDDDERGGKSGQGEAAGGEIHYRDIYTEVGRDDLLSEAEQKIKLKEHDHRSEKHIKDAKLKSEEYKNLREEKQKKGLGQGSGPGSSPYKEHFLAKTVAFGTGRDNKWTPSNNNDRTNPESKEGLENRQENRLENKPAPTPHSAPKPSPFGPK